MKDFIRSIFRIRPFEKALVFMLGKSPNRLLRLLQSSNNAYPPNSTRLCNRHGINYCLDINDYQNWLLYFYSDTDSSFGVLKYINKGDVIIDVGGNIGQTAMMMAKQAGPGSSVYSFEPYPGTYAKFKHNLTLNPSISPQIKLELIALGASPGKLNMYEDCSTNSGANRMVPGGVIATNPGIEVPVSTLDIFVGHNKLQKIDFIKIDVEGFEHEVLKGSYQTLLTFKPALFIELDDRNLRNQQSSAIELCEYLRDIGYEIWEEGKSSPLNFYDIKKPINIYCSGKVNYK